MSSPPNWPIAAATIASQSARREMSACTANPLLPSASTIDMVSPAPSSSMSATTMRAPCCANRTAAARPCPDAPPVISATRPASRAGLLVAGVPPDTGATLRPLPRLRTMPIDPLPEAVYVPDGSSFVATELARGPWDPNAQHGGAAAALLARAIERHEVQMPARVARLTIELLRPVPFGRVDVAVRTLRPGRKVQLIEASLSADGTEV